MTILNKIKIGGDFMDLITTKELMEWLNISENTAYNWRKYKGLPYIQITRKTIMYDKEKVKEWLESKGMGGAIN